MFSTTLSLFITSFLIHQVSSISLMEVLLRSTIQSAQCEARCQGLDNQDDLQDCLGVCSVIIKNNDDSLCMFPRLCTGGCRVACQDNEVNDAMTKRRISGVTQTSCHLDWSLKEGDNNDNVVYIVAGVDHAGMISIISGSILETKMETTPAMTSKFFKMTVLAVNSNGLLDMMEIDIEPQDACENFSVEVEETTFETIPEHESDNNQIHESVLVKKLTYSSQDFQIALFITIILILTIIMSIIIYFFCTGKVREKRSEGDKYEEDSFLDSECWIV